MVEIRGDLYADKVLSYSPFPGENFKCCMDPQAALGALDRTYVALGGPGGVLELEFLDNTLIDLPGKDLRIVELGSAISSTAGDEPYDVYLFVDGEYRFLGRGDGPTDFDLADAGILGPITKIRLVDRSTIGSTIAPGSDIVAVIALSAGLAPTPAPLPTPTRPPTPTPPARAGLEGRFLFNGDPITNFTQRYPLFRIKQRKSQETCADVNSIPWRTVFPTYDDTIGIYALKGLEAGYYCHLVNFDAGEPFDGNPIFPGDLISGSGFGTELFLLPGETKTVGISLLQFIHLTNPVDNSSNQILALLPGSEVGTPVQITWVLATST